MDCTRVESGCFLCWDPRAGLTSMLVASCLLTSRAIIDGADVIVIAIRIYGGDRPFVEECSVR
jgi:hypothetical protein